jgi:hypothetical protein
MAKFYGTIGYVDVVEIRPGVFEERVTERVYSGDLLRKYSKWSSNPDSVNDNLSVNSQISILADPYAYKNFHSMRYVEFMDAKWKITSIEVKYPRLILDVGGVYNGTQT